MRRMWAVLTILLVSMASQASLLETPVQEGPHKGESLLAVVSKTVPEKAVRQAFSFFDRNQGLKRSSLIYSMRPKTNVPGVLVYDCNERGQACRMQSVEQNLFANTRYMVIFDLNQSSMTPRLHIVDLMTADVVSLFASHGKESTCANDPRRACKFISNRDSDASPLGFFVTGSTVIGEVGFSIPLIGLQGPGPGTERNDVPSTIVIHGAKYASPDFRRAHGYMGRSRGCPALSYEDIATWKDRLQNGALFYFFHDSLPAEPAPVSYVFN